VSAIGLIPSGTMDLIEQKIGVVTKKHGPLFRKFSPVFNAASVVIILLCLMLNLDTIPGFVYKLQTPVEIGANAIRLDQYWGMFSPNVLSTDGWMVYDGRDSIGRQHDLRTDSEYVDFKKPDRIVSLYKTDRWRKLAENMQDGRFSFLRPLYCRYILHKWNVEHPDKKMRLMNLYFMQKENLADYQTTVPEKILYSVCDEK
jgi:hypothetical protein